jgi:uncharacterized glyoxalase superfamily protein PhnB
MPEPRVVPMPSYENCAEAADWLKRAFGFEEVERFDEDGEVTHVTLRIGNGYVYIGKPGDAYVDPVRLRQESETVARMYDVPWVINGVCVEVDDLRAHYERAREAGARMLSEIEPGPGGDLYRVEDPFGHRWMFAQG